MPTGGIAAPERSCRRIEPWAPARAIGRVAKAPDGADGSRSRVDFRAVEKFPGARPDRGSVRFGAREIIRRLPPRRDAAMVFRSRSRLPHMAMAGNIALELRQIGRFFCKMVERQRCE